MGNKQSSEPSVNTRDIPPQRVFNAQYPCVNETREDEMDFINKQIIDTLEKVKKGMTFTRPSRFEVRSLSGYDSEVYYEYLPIDFTEFYKDCWNMVRHTAPTNDYNVVDVFDSKDIPLYIGNEHEGCCELNITHFRIVRREKINTIIFLIYLATDEVKYKVGEREIGECRLVFLNICDVPKVIGPCVGDTLNTTNSYYLQYMFDDRLARDAQLHKDPNEECYRYNLRNLMEFNIDELRQNISPGRLTKSAKN